MSFTGVAGKTNILLQHSAVTSYLPTPAKHDSPFLSERACHHPAPASPTPRTGPSSTPTSSWKTPLSCDRPPGSCPFHPGPEREHSGVHSEQHDTEENQKAESEKKTSKSLPVSS